MPLFPSQIIINTTTCYFPIIRLRPVQVLSSRPMGYMAGRRAARSVCRANESTATQNITEIAEQFKQNRKERCSQRTGFNNAIIGTDGTMITTREARPHLALTRQKPCWRKDARHLRPLVTLLLSPKSGSVHVLLPRLCACRLGERVGVMMSCGEEMSDARIEGIYQGHDMEMGCVERQCYKSGVCTLKL